METKELNIEIPVGYEIDKEKSTFEKIIFKKKDNRPRSWEEYLCCGNHPNTLWFINPTYINTGGIKYTAGDLKDFDLNKSSCLMSAYLPSKELAEAFLAMMKLMSLRQEWIHRWSVEQNLTEDWKPDWSCDQTDKYFIQLIDNKEFDIQRSFRWCRSLSFPTYEMTEDFIRCFKEFLEIAKPLI